MSGKRIVFVTFGSLGDLHPCLALARALTCRGHRPLVATFDALRESVEQAGIEYAPLRPATAQFGAPAEVMRRLVDPWRGPEFLVREMFMGHLRETWEDLAAPCRNADLIVTHPLAFAATLFAEARAIKWVSTVLSPLSLFSAYDPPSLPLAPWLRLAARAGPRAWRAVFALPRLVMRHWEKPLRRLRAELGLPLPGPLAQVEGQYSPWLNLVLFSPLLAAPQPDWPPRTVVCGFPRYDGPPPAPAVRRQLDDFLAAGDPPLVFALGSSAVMVAGDFWAHAIAATQQLGRRAILLTGAPSEALGRLPPSICAFPYLPYSAVFPHAAVTVHSGGIGTLAQALAAGRPQLVVPVAFDQPDNARRTVALGVGRALPFRAARPAALARELGLLIGVTRYVEQAGMAARVLRDEQAVATACDALLAV